MAITYTGKQGKKYSIIEPAVGKGGEGSVYKISGMPDYVLKVFADSKRTESRHRKLLAMIATPLSPSAMQQITWPTDVVYQNGNFAGYVMPAIKNNEDLNIMYSDKYICTLSEKITIAKNLCAAINAVHEAGQVCGDLNPKNIGVDPQSAKVTLVDTDSYHITEKGGTRVYRCEVGMPEYLPKEIQVKMKNGLTLVNAPLPTFNKYTDLFALAVHIFALLMNGCHPFACAVSNKVNIAHLSASQPSVAAPQPIDNICSDFFPFYEKRQGITTPKYAPDFDTLPKFMQDLFVLAFVDGQKNPSKRPDTVTWYNALTQYQQNLSTCSKDKSHMYSSHLRKCPWCEVESRLKAVVPVTPPPQNTATSNPATWTYNNPTLPNTPPSSNPQGGGNVQNSNDGIMASSGMFWFLTLAIPLAIQAIILSVYGEELITALFGSGHGSGIESWGVNIAAAIGPWGFVICGIIGTCLYNSYASKNASGGYKAYNYVLSIISSLLSAAAWVLVVFLVSFAILIIALIIIVVVICNVISGG